MSVPNDLRQMNRRQIVMATLRAGPTTRSVLARTAGISQSTTGKIVDDLIEEGILSPATVTLPVQTGPGRPGFVVKLDDTRPRFLAVQFGPNRTRLAPLALSPLMRDHWVSVIQTPHSLRQWAAAVAAAAAPMLREPPSFVLVSLPGVLDDAGRTLFSPTARWTEGEDVAAALTAAMGLPAFAVQEAQCLALGHRAADPTADNYLLVDFGTGIGSAAISRGELVRGPLPFGGEIGHTPVAGNTRPCGCGGVGCLNTLVGRERLLAVDDVDTLTVPEAIELAGGDRLHEALRAAGLGIASALNVLGMDHVVVTGFVADLPPESFAVLRQSIAGAAMAGRFGVVRTDAAPRHRLAGLASVGIDRMIAPAGANGA